VENIKPAYINQTYPPGKGEYRCPRGREGDRVVRGGVFNITYTPLTFINNYKTTIPL